MSEPTEEFLAMKLAEQTFHSNPMDLDALASLEAAEKVYFGKLGKLLAEWKAVPDSLDKMSAEQNASETEGCADDELKWVRIALATYQEIQDYKGD